MLTDGLLVYCDTQPLSAGSGIQALRRESNKKEEMQVRKAKNTPKVVRVRLGLGSGVRVCNHTCIDQHVNCIHVDHAPLY